jgi:hypothetical protein
MCSLFSLVHLSGENCSGFENSWGIRPITTIGIRISVYEHKHKSTVQNVMSTYSLGDSIARKNDVTVWYSLVKTGNWIEPAI